MNIEALRTEGTSAEIISDIFEMHFPNAVTVYDATYGKGTFWRWDWQSRGLALTAADLISTPDSVEIMKMDRFYPKRDFTEPIPGSYDVIVFDPPFTANGPNRDDSFQERYGADRSMPGAPQNIEDVRFLLMAGIREVCNVRKSIGVIVKTQSVIESGKFYDNEYLAAQQLFYHGWNVVDRIYFRGARRPQPDAARCATVKHFRNRPSVFLIAKPSLPLDVMELTGHGDIEREAIAAADPDYDLSAENE